MFCNKAEGQRVSLTGNPEMRGNGKTQGRDPHPLGHRHWNKRLVELELWLLSKSAISITVVGR